MGLEARRVSSYERDGSPDDYRPRYVDQARGYRPVDGRDAPVGAVARPTIATPPTPWAGRWQPSDAELVRWGGAVTLVPLVTPRTQAFNSTFPVPLVSFFTLNAEELPTLNAGPWQTAVRCTLTFGVGQASTNLRIDLIPAQPFALLGPVGVRQAAVSVEWPGPPLANEPQIKVYCACVPFA